jgi:hypothetical protein
MGMVKSPFLVIQRFISPLTCERIIESLPRYKNVTHPLPLADEYDTGRVTFQELGMQYLQLPILEAVPKIESHFNVKYKNLEDTFIEWFKPGAIDKLKCDNSSFSSRWTRTHNRDFSGVVFLSDYNDTVPFDGAYEVYGGKLEFPQHGFGFQPQRGTLIVYPSGPHFINYNTEIKFGDLFQVRFYLEMNGIYIHSPANFPGDYTEWFKEVI